MDPNMSGLSDTSMDMDSNQGVGQPSTPGTPSNIFSFNTALAASSASLQKRRSSTRSIKRKKFDDELVESSLAKTDRTRIKLPSFPSTGSSFSSSLPGTPIATMPLTPGLDSAAAMNPLGITVSSTSAIPESETIQPKDQLSTISMTLASEDSTGVTTSERSLSTLFNSNSTLCATSPATVTASFGSLGSSDATTVSSAVSNSIVTAAVSQSAVATSTPTPTLSTPVHTKKKKVPTATLR